MTDDTLPAADGTRSGEPAETQLDTERVQELLWHALELPETERSDWLSAQHADDAVRAEVTELLAHHEHAGTRFDHPLVGRPTESAERLLRTADGELPERFGAYRVLRRLGSGGMGSVYEAEQDSPRRTVALKVMDRGLSSSDARRRFAFEAEALARLRHPAIAQVYEAVVPAEGTPGTPWFAMEYVPGARPITTFADEQGLHLRARLALFAEVCDAVHHGHQRGVIHRDLKPANILVTDEGRPKVIDFGVARLSDPGQDSAGHTLAGQLVGTLGAMAPEQILRHPDEIDTRADVYSLGVVLYELLAGRPPHDLAGLSVPQASRVVTQTDAPRLGSVVPRLPADLDVITAKAMALEREQRFASADHLAADVRRFLDGLPIAARPPSLRYQLARFAARNTVAVVAAAVVAVALVTSTVVSLRFAWQAARQAEAAEHARRLEVAARDDADAARVAAETARSEAEHALAETERARDAEAAQRRLAELSRAEALLSAEQARGARDDERAQRLAAQEARLEAVKQATLAQRQGQRAESALDYLLQEVFAAPLRAGGTRDAELTVREALEQASASVDDLDDPWLEAEVRTFLGHAFLVLGAPEPAAQHLRLAYAIRTERADVDEDRLAYTIAGLAEAEHLLGRFDVAAALYQEALEWSERQGLGDAPAHAEVLSSYATLRRDLDDLDGALLLFAEVERILSLDPGAHPVELATARGNQATIHRLRGEYAAAASLLPPAIDSLLGLPTPPEEIIAQLATELGSCYTHLGMLDAADDMLGQALAIRRRVLDPGHPSVAHGLVALAVLRHQQGRPDEAADLLGEAAAVYRASLGEHSAFLPVTLADQGATLISAGRPAEALVPLREAVERFDAGGRGGHLDAINARSHLGEALCSLGRREEGLAELYAARDALANREGGGDPTIGKALAARIAFFAAQP